ncbi:MAG: linear amide C-N hydrolase [Anaerolineae bacterium]|nr:linear amide C-N hydrolase [Anaerolineae bacterium]
MLLGKVVWGTLRTACIPALLVAAVAVLAGCVGPMTTPTPAAPTLEAEPGLEHLPDEHVATLRSLEKVDDYPLYTMRYYGPYTEWADAGGDQGRVNAVRAAPVPEWACSLFVALAEPDAPVFGRGFDWQYSPAVLLFTDPPEGYASVSMVDIEHWYGADEAKALTDLPLAQRTELLNLPFYPYDGMNEHGLVVGMAAVPDSERPYDASKATLGSLEIIRALLDGARDVGEAVDLLDEYNITWRGGPPLHYMLADATGRAVLVEFYEGERMLLPNTDPWHLATNHLRAIASQASGSGCWRYDALSGRLQETGGQLTASGAMDLLQDVSVPTTQWSIIYGIRTGDVQVAMGRKYGEVHTFHLPLATE